ncbi:hypothetical protein D7X94_16620 [Acutalibacter sp. 1XD8-33]|uniref:hypothetical protein n=1 Tax=Acutalibacter sp. 1XD8-33 TaxID=2320081 RepID=UPI000EA2EDEF|nr:hypothetical protein [Acutalibacter sp. 1XD8-33]RKJ38386.1 hypothetical protein D7X94_16620 [Acutalibacter sp. 1XD8-33]
MKETSGNLYQVTVCPKCGKPCRGAPAISRDSTQLICPDCGTREALEGLGLSREEQEHILGNIHRYQGEEE